MRRLTEAKRNPALPVLRQAMRPVSPLLGAVGLRSAALIVEAVL